MKTVLIVDDSNMMRYIIRNALTEHGYTVVGEASNGQAGVAKYRELKPDFVTMDVTMNDLSGMDALQQIISINTNAKVVMVSAMGQDVIVRDAIMIGAKGFIVKPFSGDQLAEALAKL